VGGRDPAIFPPEMADGLRIHARLTALLSKGRPRPTFLAIHAGQVEQFDVIDPTATSPEAVNRTFSAIAGRQGVECVALAGVLRANAGKGKAEARVVTFVEWADNRWWMIHQGFGPDNELLAVPTLIAEDGWPRPSGLGGWFSAARRSGLRLHLESTQGAAPLVH